MRVESEQMAVERRAACLAVGGPAGHLEDCE